MEQEPEGTVKSPSSEMFKTWLEIGPRVVRSTFDVRSGFEVGSALSLDVDQVASRSFFQPKLFSEFKNVLRALVIKNLPRVSKLTKLIFHLTYIAGALTAHSSLLVFP